MYRNTLTFPPRRPGTATAIVGRGRAHGASGGELTGAGPVAVLNLLGVHRRFRSGGRRDHPFRDPHRSSVCQLIPAPNTPILKTDPLLGHTDDQILLVLVEHDRAP
jgi:hypothetical protein